MAVGEPVVVDVEPQEGFEPQPGGESQVPQNAGSAATDKIATANETPRKPSGLPAAPAVVVATFDSGLNPFHPCWRENASEDTRSVLPQLPADAQPLPLVFDSTYNGSLANGSLAANKASLDSMRPDTVYFMPSTRLLFASFFGSQIIDMDGHGAPASSQIACSKFAYGSQAFVLGINRADMNASEQSFMYDWLAEQTWIDVVHFNFGDIPFLLGAAIELDEGVDRLIASGKFVVLPAGNGVLGTGAGAFPTEVSYLTGPPGSLVVGSCDGSGWTVYSNYDPHVCPDGSGTRAASETGSGQREFEGTSSASPKAAGYAAELLWRLRSQFNVTTWTSPESLLRIPDPSQWPTLGPLKDGLLTAGEFHEVIRKTADPELRPDRLDGRSTTFGIPAVPAPMAQYAKQGYGKLTDATLEDAFSVLSGMTVMPLRPTEDDMYAASETIREVYWQRIF